jgi:hypothetical protein
MADVEGLSRPGPFADPLTDRIAAFIRGIGIGVEAARLDAPSLCPGVLARRGVLYVDETRLAHPGDLLHEAGHVAVCDPALRRVRDDVGDDPAEEMAAIAWSYAAARQLGIEPAIVFHEAGYRGWSQTLVESFERGGAPGTPMLEWFGMTLGAKAAAAQGAQPYPQMLRWLR